ncbi:MAG: hypothetical protein ACRBBV_13945 [Paracoccaceae bacterium]
MNNLNKHDAIRAYLEKILADRMWTISDVHRHASDATDIEKVPSEKTLRYFLSGRTKRISHRVMKAFSIGLMKLSAESKWTASFIEKEAISNAIAIEPAEIRFPVGFLNFSKSFENMGEIGSFLLPEFNPWYTWSEHALKHVPPSTKQYTFSEEQLVKEILLSKRPQLICGESGVGKTRFLYEIGRLLDNHCWLVVDMNTMATDSDLDDLARLEIDEAEGIAILLDGLERYALDPTRSVFLKRLIYFVEQKNSEGSSFVFLTTCRKQYVKSPFFDEEILLKLEILDLSPKEGTAEALWLQGWVEEARHRMENIQPANPSRNLNISALLRATNREKHTLENTSEASNWILRNLVVRRSDELLESHLFTDDYRVQACAFLMNFPIQKDDVWGLEERSRAMFESLKFNGLLIEKSDEFYLGHDLICDIVLRHELHGNNLNVHQLLFAAKKYADRNSKPVAFATSLLRNVNILDPKMIVHAGGRVEFPNRSSKVWFTISNSLFEYLARLNPNNPRLASRVFKLVRTSLSLNPSEKMRILRACASLTDFQMSELEKVLSEEFEKFQLISTNHPRDVIALAFKDHENAELAFEILSGLFEGSDLEIVERAKFGDWDWSTFCKNFAINLVDTELGTKQAKRSFDAVRLGALYCSLSDYREVLSRFSHTASSIDEHTHYFWNCWISILGSADYSCLGAFFRDVKETPDEVSKFAGLCLAIFEAMSLNSNFLSDFKTMLDELPSEYEWALDCEDSLNLCNFRVGRVKDNGARINIYDELNRKFPDDHRILSKLGWYIWKHGENKHAGLTYMKRAYELRPGNFEALKLYIAARREVHEEKDEFCNFLRESLEIFPDQKFLHLELAIKLLFFIPRGNELPVPSDISEGLKHLGEALDPKIQNGDLLVLCLMAFAIGLIKGDVAGADLLFSQIREDSLEKYQNAHAHLIYAQYLHAVGRADCEFEKHLAVAVSVAQEVLKDEVLELEALFLLYLSRMENGIPARLHQLLKAGVRSPTNPFQFNIRYLQDCQHPQILLARSLAQVINCQNELDVLESFEEWSTLRGNSPLN